jgi:hypothetical protein
MKNILKDKYEESRLTTEEFLNQADQHELFIEMKDNYISIIEQRIGDWKDVMKNQKKIVSRAGKETIIPSNPDLFNFFIEEYDYECNLTFDFSGLKVKNQINIGCGDTKLIEIDIPNWLYTTTSEEFEKKLEELTNEIDYNNKKLELNLEKNNKLKKEKSKEYKEQKEFEEYKRLKAKFENMEN